MASLNTHIREYTHQLSKGHIQIAYKGLMTFMSSLRAQLESQYPQYTVSALYFGYMDMTYFAFTPPELKDKKLKIALVYIHKTSRFEAWLGGSNRKIQAEMIDLLKGKDTGSYQLSQVSPGVDSIIETTLVEQPDFDRPDQLKTQIEQGLIAFIQDILSIM